MRKAESRLFYYGVRASEPVPREKRAEGRRGGGVKGEEADERSRAWKCDLSNLQLETCAVRREKQ